MGKILVFTEYSHGHLKRSAQELLTAARSSGQTVAALAVGSQSATITEELKKYGAQEIHLLKDAQFDQYNPELFTAAICDVVQKSQATAILASASSTGKDLFPRVGARLNSGVLSDCTELRFSGDNIEVTRPLFSGKCFAKATFDISPVKIVLMRANQLPVSESPAASTQTTEHSFSKPDLKTVIKEIVRGTSEKLDLTEANIIVSGGRGLKEAANFKLLNDLADVLGATVGASRAVVDAGWCSHGMQVGQTGKTVAPSLYIAVGVSGAIQHVAGMSGSKVIVAINNDPNAPIFQKATYGIVGDLFDVVPKLTEEFKKVMK
ncbi:MAG: electron transfer flavoprotein subunit alpha [Oligoflexia bacterium]|nr:MAG: electron transfer flavoprotein subunit alpha [Oligoflexia bacterium]